MKNIIKLLGVVVLTAVIGFSMISCGEEEIEEEDPAFFGETLKFENEQVSQWDDTKQQWNNSYSGTHSDIKGPNSQGIGTITNGKFSFELDRPTAGYFQVDGTEGHFSGYEVTFNPPTALVFLIEEFIGSNCTLSREMWEGNLDEANATGSESQSKVFYIYVDVDCQVTGEGDEFTDNDSAIKITDILEDFTLDLRRGWTAINYTHRSQGLTQEIRSTTTISKANPWARWVVWSD